MIYLCYSIVGDKSMAIDYYSKGVAQLEKGIAYNIRREGQSRCNRRKQKKNNNKKTSSTSVHGGEKEGVKKTRRKCSPFVIFI